MIEKKFFTFHHALLCRYDVLQLSYIDLQNNGKYFLIRSPVLLSDHNLSELINLLDF